MNELNSTRHHRRGPALPFMLAAALLAGAADAFASQADAVGAIWGRFNNAPVNTVFASDTDIVTPPGSLASVANSYMANGFTFEYFASAGIDTGLLKVKSLASSDGSASGTYTSASGSGMPSIFARILENVSFTPPDNNPYPVDVSMAVDGTYQLAPSSTGFAFANLSVNELGSSNSDFAEMVFSPDPGTLFANLGAGLMLQGPQTVNIVATLSSQIFGISGSNQLSEFAFDQSAQLFLSVPAGVTVTSDSGFFLANAVPLPPAGWLLLGGVLGLARMRRASTAPAR